MREALQMFDTKNGETGVHVPESLLPESDIAALQSAGLISLTLPRPGDWPCRTFSVDEPAKKRRRWIVHPSTFNKHLPCSKQTDDRFLLPIPSDIMKKVSMWRFARCIDLTAYYHQFGLVGGCGDPRFIFREGGSYYAVNTIPTGGSCCPKLAQNFSLMLAEEAVRRFHAAHCTSEIIGAIDVYIDNFRVLANSVQMVDELLKILFEVCQEMQVAINENENECLESDPQRYEFLGIQFNHEDRTTQLGLKTRTKLLSLAGSRPWTSPSVTIQEMLSMYGLLTFAATTTNVPRAKFYHAIKFMRKRASAGAPLLDPAHVWPSSLPSWDSWVPCCIEASPRFWREQSEDDVVVSLFTDASNSGMGSVILQGDRPLRAFGSKWSPFLKRKHINLLEAHAVLRGLIILQATTPTKDFPHLAIDVHIDNTSVLFTTMKGSSRSFELNAIIGQIWRLPITKQVRSWQYVRSADNLADTPSRWFQNPRDLI